MRLPASRRSCFSSSVVTLPLKIGSSNDISSSSLALRPSKSSTYSGEALYSVSLANSSLRCAARCWVRNVSKSPRALERLTGPAAPPSVGPTKPAWYAALPYSCKASGLNSSNPACARSNTCCATSVGISTKPRAAPLATVGISLASAALTRSASYLAAFLARPSAISFSDCPRILLTTRLPKPKPRAAVSRAACPAAAPYAFVRLGSISWPAACCSSAWRVIFWPACGKKEEIRPAPAPPIIPGKPATAPRRAPAAAEPNEAAICGVIPATALGTCETTSPAPPKRPRSA